MMSTRKNFLITIFVKWKVLKCWQKICCLYCVWVLSMNFFVKRKMPRSERKKNLEADQQPQLQWAPEEMREKVILKNDEWRRKDRNYFCISVAILREFRQINRISGKTGALQAEEEEGRRDCWPFGKNQKSGIRRLRRTSSLKQKMCVSVWDDQLRVAKTGAFEEVGRLSFGECCCACCQSVCVCGSWGMSGSGQASSRSERVWSSKELICCCTRVLFHFFSSYIWQRRLQSFE